jgi:hypothetical protein
LKALIRREGAKGTAIGEADVDLLRKMDPLRGQVEWSTWGSKLESIFSPVFSSVPTLVSSQWVGTVNTPLEVFLPGGLSKAALLKVRDSLSYVVLERPIHGKLSEYTTLSDYITYTPNDGNPQVVCLMIALLILADAVADFVGTDFFTYRMQLGAINTAPATIAIVVEDENGERASTVSVRRRGRRSRSAGGGDDEDDDDEEEKEGSDMEKGRGGRGGKPKRGSGKRGGRGGAGGMESFEIEEDQGATRAARRADERKGSANSPGKPGGGTPFMQSLMKKMSLNAGGGSSKGGETHSGGRGGNEDLEGQQDSNGDDEDED